MAHVPVGLPESVPAGRTGRLRRVPPAVTPIRPRDLVAGAAAHLGNRGLDSFRTEIRTFLDAASVGSYTSFRRALAACLRELSRNGEGETVLVPAFCSADYSDAIEGVGLEMVRYDIDPETLAAPPATFDGLPEDVLAVVVVNVLGYSSEMEAIVARCDESETFLVEALGYGIGGNYEGTRLGKFGDCSVLNFQQGKPIPVGGGMVVSQRPSLVFGDTGRKPVGPNVGMLGGYAVCAHPTMYGVYDRVGKPIIDRIGGVERVNTHPESKVDVQYRPPYRTMSNFQGAVGSKVLERLPHHRRKRAQTAQFYREALGETTGISHVEPVAGLSNHQWVRYPLLFDSGQLREEVRATLSDHGIEATLLYDWPPLDSTQFPGARRVQQRILTLPTHPYVDSADREHIVRLIRDAST